jgi:hypothetical protein
MVLWSAQCIASIEACPNICSGSAETGPLIHRVLPPPFPAPNHFHRQRNSEKANRWSMKQAVNLIQRISVLSMLREETDIKYVFQDSYIQIH